MQKVASGGNSREYYNYSYLNNNYDILVVV